MSGIYRAEYKGLDPQGRLLIKSAEPGGILGFDDNGEDLDLPLSASPKVRSRLYALLDTLSEGDQIDIEVEFEQYTVFDIKPVKGPSKKEWDDLRERVENIERLLGLAPL